MDLLHDAIWNELKNSLEEWEGLLRKAEANTYVEKFRIDRLRLKIFDLCARLDRVDHSTPFLA